MKKESLLYYADEIVDLANSDQMENTVGDIITDGVRYA